MSQKYIRKVAGFGWVKRSYYQLYEPRLISAIYGALYFLAMVVSFYNFFEPPRTIVEAADNPWLLWIALSSLTAGGLLGCVTVATGKYGSAARIGDSF